MKFTVAFLVMLSTTTLSFAQTQEEKDSLVTVMCNTLLKTKDLPDSTRLEILFARHLSIFLSAYPEPHQDAILNAVMVRLQRNCDEFDKLVDTLYPENEYWQTVTEKPTSQLNKKACAGLFKHKKMWYHEANGDEVYFTVKKGIWRETFPNGSYSKLSFKWVGDCEFELEFIESTNTSRKNLSKPGDKYKYQINEHIDNYYRLSGEVEGSQRYDLFSVYVE